MDLHQVRCWLAVVDAGSFTAASERLHLTQPGVSYAVKQLEDALGTPLFERLGRSVTLSAAGEVFLPHARQLIQSAEVATTTVEHFKGLRAGVLTLSAVRSILPTPLATWVSAFRDRYPGVLVRLAFAGGPKAVVDQVRSGRCELGFGAGPAVPSGLVCREIAHEEFMVIFPPDLPPPSGRLTYAQLAGYPFAMPSRGSERDVYDEYFRSGGGEPEVVVETFERDVILELVVQGTACAVVPADSAREAARRGAHLRRFHPRITRPILALHRETPLSPAATEFLQLVEE
ncbi:MAG: LysR family transcriptional regulator [Myxococcota bacterium]